MQKTHTAAFFTVLGFLAAVLPALAQSGVSTPGAGSPERRAIMNALRVPVQRDLRMPVIFVVKRPQMDLRVKSGWAFVLAEFRHPNGDPMGPAYFDATHGMASSDVCALLHRVLGRWRVVTHNTGVSDVPWGAWGRQYHAPAALFPKAT